MRKSICPFLPTRFRFPAMAAFGFAAITLGATTFAQAKPFMDYLKPMPPVAPLTDATWGVAGVIPRDISNGIESARGKAVHPEFYYWDGQIIRAKDGKFHMFMSRFSGNTNFGSSWLTSDAYHAISETNVLGPYVPKDFVYTYNGKHTGHNVTAFELPGGGYGLTVSENVRPFTIFRADSLDGPWTSCNPSMPFDVANVSIFPRHDGKFQLTYRNGGIAIADTLCGTYKKVQPKCTYPTANADTVYPKRTSIPGVTNPNFTWEEDPHIWYSAGTYHIIYSGSGDRVGYHLYSPDGINDWKDNGYGWSPREYKKIFCYEGSTVCNAWYKMERPSVVLQDGHPTHATWAVSDVDKDNQVTPTANSGTKIIVIPFDGIAFDNDFGSVKPDGGVKTDTAPVTDGPAGTGGTTGTGGAVGGTGGSGAGGAARADASAGSGGLVADGGRGGSSGSGGGVAGSVATGGISMGAGGAMRTGGSTGGTSSVGTGGVSGTGGSATGGVIAASGGAASGGQAGATSRTGGTATPVNQTESGCSSCTLQGRPSSGAGKALLLLGFVLVPVLRRRRSGRSK